MLHLRYIQGWELLHVLKCDNEQQWKKRHLRGSTRIETWTETLKQLGSNAQVRWCTPLYLLSDSMHKRCGGVPSAHD